MKGILVCVFLTVALLAKENNVTSEEAAQGWIALFDGETLFGWSPEGKAQWKVVDGAIVADSGEYGWLRHEAAFADFQLKAEFRTAADGNSGIFIRASREGAPHLTGYEVQIFDQHEKYPTGSLVGHAAAKGGAIKPGEWQMMEIATVGDRFLVKLDGNLLVDARDLKSRVGHIGLQYNKGKPIAFRNLKLRPLGLKPVTGWHKVEPAKPAAEPAQWQIGESIHVEKGPGQIETTGTWADFVLQLDIKTNPRDANHHPNSGVFFRGTPNAWWSGYESQIRNEYSDDDPGKPVDFGTGAIYRTNPARRIVAKDGEFFTKTIVVRGRQINVWVNGYPVTAWSDPNPEGTNVRDKQAVLKAGTISLQAHDPTTNLDFKNIRIAALPAQ
jgi:hypothetical protein